MRILYLTDRISPINGEGIGMYVDIVGRSLSERGHQVTVLTADDSDQAKTVSDRLNCVRFTIPEATQEDGRSRDVALRKAYLQWTLRLIDRDGAPDIIEVADDRAIGYYVLQAKYLGEARLQNVKIVVHCHAPSFEINRINRNAPYRFPNYWIGQMEKFCLRAADALLTPSAFLKHQLSPFTGGNDISVIPLPYRFAGTADHHSSGKYLLCTGPLEYRSGVWQLLPIIARYWEAGDETPLILSGRDIEFAPRGQTLGTLIAKKYQKWIDAGLLKLNDPSSPDEADALIANARAVVIPSLYQTDPYMGIVPMSQGVPVIVSRQSGEAGILTKGGVDGFVFDWDVEGDCCRVLGDALKCSGEKLREVGENGRRRARSRCETDANTAVREAWYQSVLTQDSSDGRYPFAQALPRSEYPEDVAKQPCEAGLLSVVIPYYNLAETVGETIQSILASDYPKREIILLDDGSTDEKSVQTAREIVSQIPEVRLVRIDNGGLANARNVGTGLARGEYLCFVDADDTIEPSYFRRCIDLLKRYDNVSYVFSWMRYFGVFQDIWVSFDTELPFLCAQNMAPAMAVSRRKDYLAFGHNHVDMEYGLEDFDGWLGMAENGCFGVCIPEPLTNYRIRRNSMLRGMNRNANIFLRSSLLEKHPALYAQYEKELFLLLTSNGTTLDWQMPLGAWENNDVSSLRAMYEKSRAEALALQMECDGIRIEMERIKERRGYKLIDALSRRIYGTKIGYTLRFKTLPALKRLTRHH